MPEMSVISPIHTRISKTHCWRKIAVYRIPGVEYVTEKNCGLSTAMKK